MYDPIIIVSVHVLPLWLSPLPEDTSVITVSSCGLRRYSQPWGRKLKHWTYICTFVAFLNITLYLFLSSWGVIGRERDSHVDSGMLKFLPWQAVSVLDEVHANLSNLSMQHATKLFINYCSKRY